MLRAVLFEYVFGLSRERRGGDQFVEQFLSIPSPLPPPSAGAIPRPNSEKSVYRVIERWRFATLSSPCVRFRPWCPPTAAGTPPAGMDLRNGSGEAAVCVCVCVASARTCTRMCRTSRRMARARHFLPPYTPPARCEPHGAHASSKRSSHRARTFSARQFFVFSAHRHAGAHVVKRW